MALIPATRANRMFLAKTHRKSAHYWRSVSSNDELSSQTVAIRVPIICFFPITFLAQLRFCDHNNGQTRESLTAPTYVTTIIVGFVNYGRLKYICLYRMCMLWSCTKCRMRSLLTVLVSLLHLPTAVLSTTGSDLSPCSDVSSAIQKHVLQQLWGPAWLQ